MKTTLSDDVFFCFGFGMMLCGFLFHQYWWLFGGFMIFIMPVMAKEADKHSRHPDDEFQID